MKWVLMGMAGAVLGVTVWFAAFGDMPEDIGIVLVGTSLVIAMVFAGARWEDMENK